MNQGAAFSFLGWIALLSGIWFLFDKSETVASVETKAAITRWLKRLDPASEVATWPVTFIHVFDHVFGQRHLSWKCFVRSSIASYMAVPILTVLWGALRPNEFSSFWQTWGTGMLDPVLIFGVSTVFLNVFPDYLSLLETRILLGWMSKTLTIWRIFLGLTLDFLVTTSIPTLTWYLLTAIISLLVHPQGLGRNMDRATAIIIEAISISAPNQGGVTFGIWFYAAFLTSAWVWLYAASGAVMKLYGYLGPGLSGLRIVLDIENRPITSLGWVSMTLATVVYRGVALARWYRGG